uniref:Uncharacterized protein n=1 Tax=Faecalibaculum rodentium TaxID=1702221 RepID=A0A140DSB8_9FIRM|nr:hypothetical protein AALO17_04110 [Faecalibaculum rodentium]
MDTLPVTVPVVGTGAALTTEAVQPTALVTQALAPQLPLE